MNQRIKAATGIAVLGTLLAVAAVSRPRVLCEGFLPPNDLQILETDPAAGGITEAQFNAVLDRAQEVYGPIVAAAGGNLVINRLWTNGTVNASAYQSGGTWYLNMYGGLARHPTITVEGFTLVACHELGHHLGAFPKYDGNDWATNEGGADYYATLKCLRRVFPAGSRAETLDPIAEKTCAANFPDEGSRAHCGKGTMAGVSVAELFRALRRETAPYKLDTPDPKQVAEMYDAHPAGQCRLDTYYQGALCTKPITEAQSETEPGPGACTAAQGYTTGIRPRCWYKPPEGQAKGASLAAAAPLELPDSKGLQDKLDSYGAALGGGR
ncbi:MAG: hypothetical protein HY553_19750 [Elusimicrobia bacterium]|nr:hypothetical protein [Elusimicrobiota bacterium]